MEGNRDEADRCIEIALTAINSGDYIKAEKFLYKADKLYTSERAKDLLKHVKAMSNGNNNNKKSSFENHNHDDKANLRQRHKENESTHEDSSTTTTTTTKESIDYTQEQLEIVKKIKKCKDYYEVLSITKEATDSEIKKAYKKLALQLHPDKNRAPGAAEAFKAIGNAVAILTDPRKRKEYDLFGQPSTDQSTTKYNHTFNSHRRNNFEYAYERGFESDISAEELFNMFFGGFPQQRRQPFSQHQQQQHHHHETNQQPSLAFGLILILIMISMLSSFFTSDPLYSLSQTSKYPNPRQTSHLGISYYVKDNFAEEYQGSIARLENSVEEDYIAIMKQNCYRERTYRETMIARARSFGNRYQVAQAQSLKTPSCDNLSKLGLNRFSYY